MSIQVSRYNIYLSFCHYRPSPLRVVATQVHAKKSQAQPVSEFNKPRWCVVDLPFNFVFTPRKLEAMAAIRCKFASFSPYITHDNLCLTSHGERNSQVGGHGANALGVNKHPSPVQVAA